MPQMAPISWLFLFIMFTVTFILFNIMNYYIFIYSPVSSDKTAKKSFNSLNWKW